MSARRRLLPCALLCAACLLPAASAGAAGPPLPSAYSGSTGAVAPGGDERLVTRRAGPDTVVAAVSRRDGRVLRSRRIEGRWSVPPVTLDGATTGLSAGGGTLVLARPERDFPPTSTRLAVVGTRDLRVRREIALAGFFTVDAISPDGRLAYVIQYGADVLDYRVRALDTRTGRLAARDVVDPRNPGEQMGGLPMARATSRDGRWAYTLYGGGEETFIHALDTVGRTAACIDLDMLPPGGNLDGVRLRVSADGRRVRVVRNRALMATVDARSFAVREPGRAVTHRAPASPAADVQPAPPSPGAAPPADRGGIPWPALLLGGGLAALCALTAGLGRRRARTPVGTVR